MGKTISKERRTFSGMDCIRCSQSGQFMCATLVTPNVEMTGAARLHRAASGGMMGSATLQLRVPFFAPKTFRDER